MKILRKYFILSLCLFLMACGSTNNSNQNKLSNENVKNKESENEKLEEDKKTKEKEEVFRAFNKVLEERENYAEDKENAKNTRYWYSLAYMDKTDIPVLLLKMNSNFKNNFKGPSTMKLFGFVNGQVKQLPYKTFVGEALAGHSKVNVYQLEDNDGLHITSVSSGGQDGIFYKLQFESGNLKIDETPFKIENNTIKSDAKVRELNWYEIDDLSFLEEILGKNSELLKKLNEESLKNLKEGQKVCEGTLKIFTERELLEFQNINHPNPSEKNDNNLYTILILDKEDEILVRTVNNQNGTPLKIKELCLHNTSQFSDAEYNSKIEKYKKFKDKKVKVIYDGKSSFLPSDIRSLPVNIVRVTALKIID